MVGTCVAGKLEVASSVEVAVEVVKGQLQVEVVVAVVGTRWASAVEWEVSHLS